MFHCKWGLFLYAIPSEIKCGSGMTATRWRTNISFLPHTLQHQARYDNSLQHCYFITTRSSSSVTHLHHLSRTQTPTSATSCLPTLQPALQPSNASHFDKHAEIDKKPCWKMPLLALFLPFSPPSSSAHFVSTSRIWEDRNGFLSDTNQCCHLACQLVKEDGKGGGDKW